jgi:hypothetical protein
MFSRPFIDYKNKTNESPAVLGRFFNVPTSNLKIYLNSWVIDKLYAKIILEEDIQFSMRTLLAVTNDFIIEALLNQE